MSVADLVERRFQGRIQDPLSFSVLAVQRPVDGLDRVQAALSASTGSCPGLLVESGLSNAGIEQRRGLPPVPNFDLAWQKDRTVFVAEVKSITAENEEHQLRLGLGQVLQYR